MAKQVCHVCTNKIKTQDEQLLPTCPHCGTNLANPTEEFVQMPMMAANYFKAKSGLLTGALQGRAVLTNRRLLWFDQSAATNAGAMFGLVGAAIAAAAATTKDLFAIPLESIASVTEAKKGLAKQTVITTHDGTEYKFSFAKRQKMQDAIQADVDYFRQYGQAPAHP